MLLTRLRETCGIRAAHGPVIATEGRKCFAVKGVRDPENYRRIEWNDQTNSRIRYIKRRSAAQRGSSCDARREEIAAVSADSMTHH